eukprot:scaffold44126_cov51-Phaeocystis_antarctica.AAC.1
MDRLVQVNRALERKLCLAIGRDRQAKVLLTDHRQLHHTPVLCSKPANARERDCVSYSVRFGGVRRVLRRTGESPPSLPPASNKSSEGGAVRQHHALASQLEAAFCCGP